MHAEQRQSNRGCILIASDDRHRHVASIEHVYHTEECQLDGFGRLVAIFYVDPAYCRCRPLLTIVYIRLLIFARVLAHTNYLCARDPKSTMTIVLKNSSLL